MAFPFIEGPGEGIVDTEGKANAFGVMGTFGGDTIIFLWLGYLTFIMLF